MICIASFSLVVGCERGDPPSTEGEPGPHAELSPEPSPPEPSPTEAKPGAATKPKSTALSEAQHDYERTPIQTTVSGEGEGPYEFKATWHTEVIELWREQLADYAGEPNLRYLEVGVFEGRSMIWMLENVLTHESSRATGADLLLDFYAPRLRRNLEASGAADRVELLKGPSQETLRGLHGVEYDIIYIDGLHTAAGVLADLVLSWDLLAVGGLMILDDYAWPGRNEGVPIPAQLRPQVAIDAFVTAHRDEVELLHRDWQVILRRTPNPCGDATHCRPIGPYLYSWNTGKLETREGEPVALSDEERTFLEYALLSRKFGSVGYTLKDTLASAPQFQALRARLGLELPEALPRPSGL